MYQAHQTYSYFQICMYLDVGNRKRILIQNEKGRNRFFSSTIASSQNAPFEIKYIH